MIQSGLSTLKRIQSFDFDQALQQSEHALPGSFLSSNGGGLKKPLADSQLFAAKLKKFQDFFEQS